jgi:hypothetical protein
MGFVSDAFTTSALGSVTGLDSEAGAGLGNSTAAGFGSGVRAGSAEAVSGVGSAGTMGFVSGAFTTSALGSGTGLGAGEGLGDISTECLSGTIGAVSAVVMWAGCPARSGGLTVSGLLALAASGAGIGGWTLTPAGVGFGAGASSGWAFFPERTIGGAVVGGELRTASRSLV